MEKSEKKNIEKEQAGFLAELSLKVEKFCQIKEKFFADRFNLTPAEIRCLNYIKNNIIVTTKTIAKEMNLSTGRITHLLNVLGANGLINRQVDDMDRRSVLISLTGKAKELFEKIFDEYLDLHVKILSYLPSNRRTIILKDLEYYFDALSQWEADFNKS